MINDETHWLLRLLSRERAKKGVSVAWPPAFSSFWYNDEKISKQTLFTPTANSSQRIVCVANRVEIAPCHFQAKREKFRLHPRGKRTSNVLQMPLKSFFCTPFIIQHASWISTVGRSQWMVGEKNRHPSSMSPFQLSSKVFRKPFRKSRELR